MWLDGFNQWELACQRAFQGPKARWQANSHTLNFTHLMLHTEPSALEIERRVGGARF